MRKSLAISAAGHGVMLLWGVVAFAAKPYHSDEPPPMPIDIISVSDFSKMTAGSKSAPQQAQPKPLAEKVGETKITDDPAAKVVEKKEITASTDAPPPMPEPKPPEKEKKKAASKPKPDLIAEALKKEEAKVKSEEKKEAKAVPTPPKRPHQPPQPKFDPKKVEALLDKRAPQRLASTGPVLNEVPSLGAPSGQAAQLSQSELDALRARLAQLWSPPAGAKNPQELVVTIRVRLNRDGTLLGGPMVMTSGQSQLFMASRESAMRALFRGQPFDMLRPEHYEQWKDIEITFDPRDMFRS